MALTIGTNCGFVTTAPTADPAATNTFQDTYAKATKDTSPSTAVKITEIGWWCEEATEEANFEVALYSHNAGSDKPNSRLYVSATNAKGTTSGWKTVTGLDWSISSSTIYWIAVQLDDTATTTRTNTDTISSTRKSAKNVSTTLPATWSASSIEDADSSLAYYAVWEAAAETNPSINIGDAWKEVDFANSSINIGDTWKAIAGVAVNIGDTWKTVYGTP